MMRFAATSGRTGLGRWLPRACLAAAIAAHGAVAARAAEPSARSLVSKASQAMTAGDNAAALKLLQEAAELRPDSPEVAYDLGVAHYRAGDYATASEYFLKALSGRDLGLEQRARFNLGNCAYSEGLKEKQDAKGAIEKFKAAADRFREALQLDPRDGDARANLERSGLMIRQLKEEQEQKKQEQQGSQPSSQPESQPSSQPEKQPQSQPSSRPENQQGKQGEDKEAQQEQAEQQKGEQKEGEKKDGKLDAAEQQEGERNKDQQAQSGSAEQKTMSKEEAERLLQLIRDKERQRREGRYNEDQKGRSRQGPVDKDW